MIGIHKQNPWSLLIYGLVSVIISILVVSVIAAKPADASGPITDFNPGRIIEDSVFTNSVSMSPAQIQSFLNNKVPVCDTWGTQTSEFGGGTRAQWGTAHGYPPPYVCLRDYVENSISAAQIIYNVSQQYQINPQVLIVLLQKEQALVTDTWPLTTQYKTATGYGCPDTAACDSQYYGFTNQVTWSAKMFRAVLNNSPTWYSPYVLGNNTIQWNPNASCGSSVVNIQNRSTQALYDYTPYRPNQAALNAGYGTGDGCSAYGNRNFYLYFRDWFGYNSGPAAFKTTDSSTIYMPITGYRFAVPYTASMQDYGISLEAVQTVSQSYVDSIPTPPNTTGLSTSISHIIKSPDDGDEDGGSVYLISLGKRYKLQVIQQLYDFGFTDTDISYLPLSYIYSMNDGGPLYNFVKSPYGNVFKLESQTKKILFEYDTYINQNPTDRITSLSYFLINKIPSGNPITTRPVLIKTVGNNSVHLYQNNVYYSIPNYDIFSCWGFDGSAGIGLNTLQQSDYIAPIITATPLSCLINDGQSNTLMNRTYRSTVPDVYGLSGVVVSSDLTQLSNKLPLRATPLKQYIKSSDASAVWYVSGGARKLIPSYNSFVLLGLNDSSVDSTNQSFINTIPDAGIKLADGQLVKDSSSAAIYVIGNNKRVLYPSSDLFVAYNNSWSSIETYTQNILDQYYPTTGGVVSDYLIDASTNTPYIIGQNGCFHISGSTLTALGTDIPTLSSSQAYSVSIFKGLSLSCDMSSNFIKQADQNLVYWIDSGQKHALNTYSSMLDKNGGIEPRIMEVTGSFISNLPSGQAYN